MGSGIEKIGALAGGPAGAATYIGKNALRMVRGAPAALKWGLGGVGVAGMAQVFNYMPHVSTSSSIAAHVGKGKITQEFVIPNAPTCFFGWDDSVPGAEAKWKGNITVSQKTPFGTARVSLPDKLQPTVTAKSNNSLKYEVVGCLDKDSFGKSAVTYDPNSHSESVSIPLGTALHMFVTRTDPTKGIDVVDSRIASLSAVVADLVNVGVPDTINLGSSIDSRVRGIVDYMGQYVSAEGCLRTALPGLNTAAAKTVAGAMHGMNFFNDPKVTEDNIHVNLIPPTPDQVVSYSNLDGFQTYVANGKAHRVDLNLPPVSGLQCTGDAGTVISKPLTATPLGGS